MLHKYCTTCDLSLVVKWKLSIVCSKAQNNPLLSPIIRRAYLVPGQIRHELTITVLSESVSIKLILPATEGDPTQGSSRYPPDWILARVVDIHGMLDVGVESVE